MIELPESYTLAKQFTKALQGKVVRSVVAGASLHRFAWYFGDESLYDAKLRQKTVGQTKAYGGHVEMELEEMRLDFSEGINFMLLQPKEKRPPKHQLLVEFEDGTALLCRVQMYGGLCAFLDGENENPYYLVGKQTPSPLTPEFDETYFSHLLSSCDQDKLSCKAFLATDQRIPGLGNGVAQDILLYAKLNPRRKINTLSNSEKEALFGSIKQTLRQMADFGGRDTEKDLFQNPGGYKTALSKNNKLMVCPVCGSDVRKETFLGGSIYYCTVCQPKEQ